MDLTAADGRSGGSGARRDRGIQRSEPEVVKPDEPTRSHTTSKRNMASKKNTTKRAARRKAATRRRSESGRRQQERAEARRRRARACGPAAHGARGVEVPSGRTHRAAPHRRQRVRRRPDRRNLPRLQRRAPARSLPALHRENAGARRHRRPDAHRRAHAGGARHVRAHSAHRGGVRGLDHLHRRESLSRHALRPRPVDAPWQSNGKRHRAARRRHRPHLRHLLRLRRAAQHRRVLPQDRAGPRVPARR